MKRNFKLTSFSPEFVSCPSQKGISQAKTTQTPLLGVLAQRLVRTLCPECKERYKASNKEKEVVGITGTEDVFLYRPVGCKACNNTGYKGRTGIHELLLVNNEVRESINEAKGELYIENLIRPYTPSIKQDGMNKVLQGKTTAEKEMAVNVVKLLFSYTNGKI